MMNIKINWDKLKSVHQHLTANLKEETEITFTMIMRNGTVKKSLVKFKDFLNFFWLISTNPKYKILTLVVQDKEGRILYRHKQITNGDEEIPVGGNANVIRNWNTLTREEKDVFLRITIAQINGYQR